MVGSALSFDLAWVILGHAGLVCASTVQFSPSSSDGDTSDDHSDDGQVQGPGNQGYSPATWLDRLASTPVDHAYVCLHPGGCPTRATRVRLVVAVCITLLGHRGGFRRWR